jgi:hypothetical protein
VSTDESNTAAPPRSVRATGFVSAVLLVVLLATTGLPVDAQHLGDEQQVACCVVQRTHSAFRPREPEDLAGADTATIEVAPPRVAPRTARVDSWGLPPPRAPTNRR